MTRTFWRRGVLPLSCLALLAVCPQAGRPQPGADPLPLPASPKLAPLTVPAESNPPVVKPTVAPPPPPAPTVEDLIRELERVQKQRADLEAQEKALVAKLRERLKDQGDRLTKLGVLPQVPPPPVVVPADDSPPRITVTPPAK